MPSPPYSMTSHRPFFSNFLAAFRAHSALKTSPSVSTSTTSTSSTNFSSQTTHFTQTTQNPVPQQLPSSTSSARAITAKTPSALNSAAAAFSPPSHSHTHRPRHSPKSSNTALTSGAASSTWGGRRRRGSDSSNEGGFRDALGGEKWYIGGRTGTGEERFYQLSMVRRERSNDRASCDRMSL